MFAQAARPLLRSAGRYFSSTRTLAFQITQPKFAKHNVVVPQLAESLSEGDIKFEKSVGDVVKEDDVLAAIETDKTSIPINSPVSGKVIELLVEDSSTVKPGQMVIVIDTDGSGAGPDKPAPPKPSAEAPQATPQTPTQGPKQQSPSTPSPPPPPPQPQAPVRQAPVSVESVKSQLDEFSRGQFAGADPQRQQRTVSTVKMNRMRQKIASRLKDAQNTYAMLTTFNEIDMSNLMEMRNRYKDAFLKRHNVKLGFMSAFVKASAYALKEQPVVNAVIEENQILYRDYVDISVAVATPKGLVVPVLRNVDHMNFADVEKNINMLGEKAKNNTLTVADMEGGTFTISNGGVFGSLFGTPIINPPQSAILGMHSIKEKPVAINGQVVVRPVMVVALTYDHRLIDGREAVTFLKKIVEVIEDPRVILLNL
uniref:Dihydrolipoyllysine-residue succinyltransferase component of 2-oxoglutarate dehydrogenase complex, mitochondrial n=1 Tax=Aceria tosichella TaxID=561515 RepID=A0A6G1S8A6_9ACAR